MDVAPLKKRRIIATTIGIVVGFVGILAACEVGSCGPSERPQVDVLYGVCRCE